MRHFFKAVSITTLIAAIAPHAHAGSPNANQSDAELAMIEPEAGQLTAGDYDDIMNPALFKAYVDKMLQGELKGKDLPWIDAQNRIDIRVVDNQGLAFPLADIAVTDERGDDKISTRTAANGMSYLYPFHDGLAAGDMISVSTTNGNALQTTITQNLVQTGGLIRLDLFEARLPVDKLDLLLTIDASGSMGDEMKYLQVELDAIFSRVEASHPGVDIRHSLVVYRDKGDEYVFREFPFTDDIDDFKATLEAQAANGGGDMPEAMHIALTAGLKMEWREDAVKVNLLVADAPPHDEHILDTWGAGQISRRRGIHIVPIAGSGVDKTAEFLMRGMAQLTGGRYLFLTDDSGIGNAHAEPTVDCYIVTQLDGLVTRVLNGLISGEREEPRPDEIIRRVGNYQSGICAADDQ